MKKKFLLTLAICALLVFAISLSVSAVDVIEDEVSYTLTKGATEEQNTALINASNKGKSFTDTVINIPAYIEYEGEKYYVTDTTAHNVFEGSNISEIYFDPGCQIKAIKAYVFKNCASLKTVVLPANLEAIGQQSFFGCALLTALYLPDSLKSIGYNDSGALVSGGNSDNDKPNAFYGCRSLFFVNELGQIERPDVWYAPSSLERICGEAFKLLENMNPTMVFGENFKKLENGYAIANKNGGPVYTIIFKADFTAEDAVFVLTCETKNRNIYFTHPNVKDTSFISYDQGWKNDSPNGNLYFCSVNEAYTMKGTASGSSQPTFTKLENGFTHVSEKSSVGAYYSNYFEKGYSLSACYCGSEFCESEATLSPVFEDRGYSIANFDGSELAAIQGVKINRDALDTLGTDIDFGVVVDVNTSGVEYSPLANGALKYSLTNSPYDYFDVKVVGIPHEYADLAIVFCAYLQINGRVFYLDKGLTLDTVIGTSYNSLKERMK